MAVCGRTTVKKNATLVKKKNTILAAFERQAQKKKKGRRLALLSTGEMFRTYFTSLTSTRPSEPVEYQLTNLFAANQKEIVCPICNQSILLTLYRAHMDKCKLLSNDSDCEIVQVLSPEESRALRAGSPIVIDDVQTPSRSSQKSASQDSLGSRRRSRKIVAKCESVEEIEIIKAEPATPKPAGPENRPPAVEAKRPHEPEKNMQITSMKRSRKTITCTSSPLLVNKSSRSHEESPSTSEDKLMKADDVIKRIEALLDTILLVSPQKNAASQNPDGNTLVMDFKRTPYIVKFTLLMIRKVLLTAKSNGTRYDETFWGKDMKLFDNFVSLSKSARELFMRLHLRKPWWLTVEKLKERYAELSATMDVALNELVEIGFVDSDKHLSSLEEVLQVASLPALRIVAKKYQIDITKGKIELISTLKSFSAKQRGLFGQTGTVAVAMVKTIKKEIGSCYRVNKNVNRIFKALFTLYAPTEMCSSLLIDQPSLNLSQNLLFTLLRMDQGAVRFPAPNPCQHILSVFDNKGDLLAYVDAKELEADLVGYLSSNKFDEAYECASKARECLIACSEECRSKAASLPMPLRRFTAFAVLMRCIAHGSGVLERQKKYAIAISWQRFLLKTPELKPFCANSRGAWWDRLALNLDAHMKEKEEALLEIEEGMKDEAVADKDKLMLQDRAVKISKGDFLEKIVLMEPVKKEINAATLSKELGDSRINRFVLKGDDGIVAECSVEEVVRKHYILKEGFDNGVHAEGSIWHTALGLLFYDIIFDHSVENVWLSELQANPIDLNSRCLYENRKDNFDKRFSWLETAADDEIEDIVRTTWNAESLLETSEINWELFQNVEDFLEFLFCCPRSGLLAILRRVVTDYRNCRSGFPDLTVWDTKGKKVAVVEVKGPGDRLSSKQRLWLDYFMRNGIRAEVCHVIAKGTLR